MSFDSEKQESKWHRLKYEEVSFVLFVYSIVFQRLSADNSFVFCIFAISRWKITRFCWNLDSSYSFTLPIVWRIKIFIFIKITTVIGDYLVFLLFRCDFFCLRFRLYLIKEKSNWPEILTNEGDWLVLFSLARKITMHNINCSFWPFTFLNCFLLFFITLRAKKQRLPNDNFS